MLHHIMYIEKTHLGFPNGGVGDSDFARNPKIFFCRDTNMESHHQPQRDEEGWGYKNKSVLFVVRN